MTTPKQTVRRTAGRRASIYAMLNILTILIADAWALGRLRELEHATEASFLGMTVQVPTMRVFALAILGLSLAFKVQCSLRTYRFARQAAREAAPTGEKAYLGNARGAKITTVLCGLVSAIVLFVAYELAS